MTGVALTALVTGAAVLGGAPAARAQATGESPYVLRPAVDLPLVAVAAAAWGLPQLLDTRVAPRCPCDAGAVNAFDRGAIGLDSRAARTASNVAVAALVALPLGLDALDVRLHGGRWAGYLADVVVMAEAVLASGAVNQTVKLAVRRPRPLAYHLPAGHHALAERDTYQSFYSAHASTAFAAGMACATTFALRHPRAPARLAVYAAAAVSSSAVATLRVFGGKHFPTDVLTGALAGTASGLLLPRLHRRGAPLTPALAPAPGGATLAMVGRWD